jgi:hypothetical protein
VSLITAVGIHYDMKKIILSFLLFCPLLISAQNLNDINLKFIEKFNTYHKENASNGIQNWPEYYEKKKEFDKNVQNFINNKDLFIAHYYDSLLKEENIKLNIILARFSNSDFANEKLQDALLSWKADPVLGRKQNLLFELFEKLTYLTTESAAVTNSSDILALLTFESRMDEIMIALNGLK